MRFLKRSGSNGKIRAVSRTIAVASNPGKITTVNTSLLGPVTFTTKTGNANASIPDASGDIYATVAIAPGASQVISFLANGADGCIQPWTLTLVGEGALGVTNYLGFAAVANSQYIPLLFGDF